MFTARLLVDVKNGLITSKALVPSLIKGGKCSFGPLFFHFLEYAPMSHCMQPAHTNAHKNLPLSTTAFFSRFKIFDMKHVKPVPLSFLW